MPAEFIKINFVDDEANSSSIAFSHGVAVAIASGYGLEDREVAVRVPTEARNFTSPYCSDRLCGPPNLLSNG
jgi:hypothetical protein